MPNCERLSGQGSTSKHEEVRQVLELTGALGGAGAWGARQLGRDPKARYLLQKQPYEVLVRAAGLTALPHVSRRHQPLARREALAVHVRSGHCCRRTTNTRRTHSETRRRLAAWTVREGLGTNIYVSLSHMRKPLQIACQEKDLSMRRDVRAFGGLQAVQKTSPASLHLIGPVKH